MEPPGQVTEVLPNGTSRTAKPRSDWSHVDATAEAEIACHAAADEAEAEARHDAAAWARGVRRRLGLTQEEFARRIAVPVATVRNWEQGKRAPRGPARALLRLIDCAPAAALALLGG